MYKKQMAFQKIVCMLTLVAAALIFVYSLGISTDLYDALSKTIAYPEYGSEYLDQTAVTGSRVYYDMFKFNSAFTKVSIGLIIVTLILFITNTHARRKYYIGNYIAVGLSTVANISMTLWCIPQIMGYKAQYQNNVNFEELKEFSELWRTIYIGPEDTFWFDVSYAFFGFLLLATCLLVLNVVWKIMMMKAEESAIGSRKGE